MFWPIRHLYLLSLSSRSENKTVSCTHTDTITQTPGLVLNLQSCFSHCRGTVSHSMTSFPSQPNSRPQRNFHSSLRLNSILISQLLLPSRFYHASPVRLPPRPSCSLHAPSSLNSILRHFSFL